MLLKGEEESYVISSSLEGKLVRGDRPLPNTKIIRRLTWNGNENGCEEIFFSDEQGNFLLPSHTEFLQLGALVQFTASTHLKVEIGSESHDIWYNSKLDPKPHSETNGRPEQLVCDLDSDEIPIYSSNSTVPNILTRCRWKNMPTDS